MKIAKDLRYYKGLLFELIGCIYLALKGYKILKWNYKIKATSQIDIVAIKKDILIVIEVKYRKNMQDAVEAISFKQQQRLTYSAKHLANKYNKTVRVDGLYFSLNRPFVCHYKNIF